MVTPLELSCAVGSGMLSDVTVIAEIAVQLDGFKNIDLFSQGVYQVRVRARAEYSGRVALPLTIQEMPLPQMAAAVSKDPLLPSHIHDRTGDACTHAFRVQYCDEEAALGMLARFRIELMLFPAAAVDEVYCEDIILELRLLHARSMTAFELTGDAERQSLASFVEVAMQRLRLKVPLPGIATFFPCTFDDFHFAYCALVIHAALLEFNLDPTGPSAVNLAAAGSSGVDGGATCRSTPQPVLQRSSSTTGSGSTFGAALRQHTSFGNDALTRLFAQLHAAPAFAGVGSAEAAEEAADGVGTRLAARHGEFLAYAATLVRTHEAIRHDLAQQRTLDRSRGDRGALGSESSCKYGDVAAYVSKDAAAAQAAHTADAGMDKEDSGELHLPDGLWIEHGGDGVGAGPESFHLAAGDQDEGSFEAPRYGASRGRQRPSEFTTQLWRSSGKADCGTGVVALSKLQVGAGWAGLAPGAWASKAAGALHELAAQLWQQWQLYMAVVVRSGVTPNRVGAFSTVFLCKRAADYAQEVQRESLMFDQRAHREQGFGTLAHATALRDELARTARSARTARTASAPRQHLADEALRKYARPALFEQTFLARPTDDGVNGGESATAITAATVPSTTDAVIAATRAEAKEEEASSSTPAQLLLSWMKLGRGDGSSVDGCGGGGGGRRTAPHVYIFVHGFHGNAYDLRGVRN